MNKHEGPVCSHLQIKQTKLPQLGASDFTVETYECGLKHKSQKQLEKVYGSLSELGWEGSLMTYKCPFVTNENVNEKDNFSLCPFVEF